MTTVHGPAASIMAEEDLVFRERLLRIRSNPSSSPLSVTSFASSSVESRLIHYGDEDMSDDEPEASAALQENLSVQDFCLSREAHAYTPWATNLNWAYIEHEEDREPRHNELQVSTFVRPCGYFYPDKEIKKTKAGKKLVAPYVIAVFSSSEDPSVLHDTDNNRLLISPHAYPYPDLRNDLNHPDYLPPVKLCQYQACEILGFPVWRHDRQSFRCYFPPCRAPLVDHDMTTRICLGCGPKTRVRYCSKAHLVEDLKHHWKECGDPSTLLRWVVDEGSQPDRFYRRYPAITDIKNKRSYQKLRQRTHAIFNKGQYTLFLGQGYPRVVEWPEDLAPIYKPLLERLLNIVLFDQSQEGVVHYLYCLLRFCLRCQNLWTRDIPETLSTQFSLEFEWDSRVCFDEDPCDCVWFGDSADKMKCTSGCKELSDRIGMIYRGRGLKFLVENLEAKHWVLRIWQRQHPEVKGWRSRLYGVGFEGVPEEQMFTAGMVPVMGKGWQGWGSVGRETGWWRKPDQPNEFTLVKDEVEFTVESGEEEEE